MPVTLVTGKLGAGKSLVSVGKIREYLLDGRPVATNVDLFLEHMLPFRARKVRAIRLPDKPTVRDLALLGEGNPTPDESRNGVIVLDELGTWLNARQWGDKDRQAVIDWLLHSRKKGWDVIFMCQHQNLIDKQVREALVEYLVVCRRLDRVKVPFIGGLLRMATGGLYSGRLPKIHVGIVFYGTSANALVAERWVFVGVSLYRAYNTRQVFSDACAHGVFSYLSPWHLVGRYRTTWWERVCAFFEGPRRKSRGPFVPHPRLRPLMTLPPDVRLRVARRLIEAGAL